MKSSISLPWYQPIHSESYARPCCLYIAETVASGSSRSLVFRLKRSISTFSLSRADSQRLFVGVSFLWRRAQKIKIVVKNKHIISVLIFSSITGHGQSRACRSGESGPHMNTAPIFGILLFNWPSLLYFSYSRSAASEDKGRCMSSVRLPPNVRSPCVLPEILFFRTFLWTFSSLSFDTRLSELFLLVYQRFTSCVGVKWEGKV